MANLYVACENTCILDLRSVISEAKALCSINVPVICTFSVVLNPSHPFRPVGG